MSRVIAVANHKGGVGKTTTTFNLAGLYAGVRTRWKQACVAAGVVPGRAGLTIHDLRRSGVRNMRRAGLSEAETMKITSHRTRSVFDRYNIVSEDDVAEAVERASAYTDQERKRAPRITPLHSSEGEFGQNTDSDRVSRGSDAR